MASAARKQEQGGRLADRVYGQLLEFILERNLDHGDRLPSEHDIARLTAASRPIVREALMRLQADGLIESRRGAGSFLRQRPAERLIHHLRPAQARSRMQAFDVRIALEPAAARLAALNRTEEEMRDMRRAVEALAAAHAALEPGETHDLHLHRAIATASRNPMFLTALDALDAEVEGIIVSSLAMIADGERARRVQLEHVAVLEAVVRGDVDCAEAAMRLHLLSARSRALSLRW